MRLRAKNLIRVLAFVLTIGVECTVKAADLDQGLDAFDIGDYMTAVREFRPLAEQGDASAQYNLGILYFNGLGILQDYTKAANWYRKSAQQGDAWAQYNLATMYVKGQGVPQDYTEAATWYRKAAEQGDADAQNSLGTQYLNGLGVPQDDAQAGNWYQAAAEQGHTLAQSSLELMYADGLNVPQDNLAEKPWYSFGDSGRRTTEGKAMVECVIPEFSPQETMESARKFGWNYTIVEDTEDQDEKPSALIITISMPEGEKNVRYFRGKKFCELVAARLHGYSVHSAERYE
jgi:TPR repeat protein